MPYPLTPTMPPKHVKKHRKMFFAPSYIRDGFKSQAEYDAHHKGIAWAELVAEDPQHPDYQRALAVLDL